MKKILNCNRCDKPFEADVNPDHISAYHRGVARQERGPMEQCPACGMMDHHYVYQRNQLETILQEV